MNMKISKYIGIILTVITLIIVTWGLAAPSRVEGDCMAPAINNGQLVFLNRIAPYLRSYKINDIVLVKHEGKIWIARIVALANDTIQITESSIVVNGSPLHESIERNWTGWHYGDYAVNEPLKIPANHVYVLSDDLSAHHDDSRVFGPIAKKAILGLVW